MKRFIITLVMALLLIVSLSVVSAQEGEEDEGGSDETALLSSEGAVDDLGVVNDPTVNDRANACYEGGTLEGKCDTVAHWAAGWYLIRLEYGELDREDVPEWAAWVLPEEEAAEEE